MNFNPNKRTTEIIKEGALVVLILETFMLVLTRSGTKIHGKNLIIMM